MIGLAAVARNRNKKIEVFIIRIVYIAKLPNSQVQVYSGRPDDS